MLPLAKFIKKEIELRENLVGTGFMEPPKLNKDKDAAGKVIGLDGEIRMTCLGK